MLKRAKPAAAHNLSGKTGSVTVEAAIALPVFLFVVITIVFLTKVVYVNGMIRHAVTEAADEMASSAYIYHISGLRDLHDTVREGLNERADIFKGHLDTVFETLGSINSLAGAQAEGVSREETAAVGTKPGSAALNLRKLLDSAGGAASNPLDMLKDIAAYVTEGTFDNINTELFTPLARLYMKKYLEAGSSEDADARLKSLNVSDGLEGLDFSGSGFFEDKDENIDIVVQYEIALPVPLKFLPRLVFVQRAAAKAWMGGDETTGVLGNTSGTGDVWSLDAFTRGRKIREAFGANLPGNFPVIAAFNSGTAVMIHSMDLTSGSYQSGNGVEKQLDEYIKALMEYSGQEKPWGSRQITIAAGDIKKKELLLVIPENPLQPEIEQVLAECVKKASQEGITLEIKRYGYKKSASSDSADGVSNAEKGD